MSAAGAPRVRPPRGYLQLLRENRNFRVLWAGQIVSLLGDWFNLVASATLVATLTGETGPAVAYLFAVRMIAPFLAGPFAGVVADRFDRKSILIVADVLRAVVVAGFLLVDEPSEVWLLYVLSFAQLGLSGFFYSARNAILPDIVERQDLGAANALSSVTWSVMLALGAGLGGEVSGLYGEQAAFAVDIATFLLSAVILMRLRPPARTAVVLAGGIRGAIDAYVDGLRYLAKHRDTLYLTLHKAANGLSGPFQVVQVAVAVSFGIGDDGARGLGYMMMAVGIGTGVAPIVARRITGDRDRSMRRALTISYGLSAVGVFVVGHTALFPVVLIGSLLRGAGGGLGWVFSTTLVMRAVPDDVRGRVFATEFANMTLMAACGTLLGGWAITQSGVGALTTVMALLLVVPIALWCGYLLRASRSAT